MPKKVIDITKGKLVKKSELATPVENERQKLIDKLYDLRITLTEQVKGYDFFIRFIDESENEYTVDFFLQPRLSTIIFIDDLNKVIRIAEEYGFKVSHFVTRGKSILISAFISKEKI